VRELRAGEGVGPVPLAFEASRVFHKGTLEALAVSGSGGGELYPLLVTVIKGLEYGCLGLGICWVSQAERLTSRPKGGAC
jgi:hypothetical protein